MKKTTTDSAEEMHGKKAGDGQPSHAKKSQNSRDGDASAHAERVSNVDLPTEDESFEQTGEDVLEAVKAVDRELSDIKDRYMRLLAEYDNFRKRTQREREGLYTDAVVDVSKEWLQVLDNVERAMSFNGKLTQDNLDPISEGMSMICKQAGEVLSKLGIEVIPDEIGTPFDPNLHAAVAHIEDDSLGEQCVAQVFLKGYKKGDRVIRHSLVQVAN